MKKLVLVTLLMVCTTANAEHHRGHSIMHIDNALASMRQSLDFAELYRDRDSAGLLPPDQKLVYDAMLSQHAADGSCPWFTLSRPVSFCIANWLGQMRTAYPKALYPEWNVAYDHIFYANKYSIYGEKYFSRAEAAREVLATGGDLNEARRILNAPGNPGDQESAVWGFIQVAANMHMAIRADSPNLAMVGKVLLQNRSAAGTLTWAIWHRTDASYEEIYDDQEFICNGPGNHCE